MGRTATVTREQLSTIPYLDMEGWSPSRVIPTLNFYVKNQWQCWIPGNNELHKMTMLPVEADYFGDSPARPTDQVFRLMNLTAQRASFSEMGLASRGLWNDFQDLGTSLAKMDLFYESTKAKKLDTARFVQTEVEFIVMVCRGVFDLLQEMIKTHWRRVELFDKSVKKKDLPKSFAEVVLHGDKPRTEAEIITKYGIPGCIAKWYTSQTTFFHLIRKMRNDMVHGGGRAATVVFTTERGFAVFRHDKPWCMLYDWPKEVELQNALVPLRPALCSIISRTIDATNTFADMYERTIVLPKPLCPGFTYFSRGYSDRQLWEMNEVVKNSYWCDTHADLPAWQETDPFEKVKTAEEPLNVAVRKEPTEEGHEMTKCGEPNSPAPNQIAAHYSTGYEADRLRQGAGQLERERSHNLMERLLPPAPATVSDIGGGPGDHACWLAKRGYEVHLIDITPLHVEMAREASSRQPETGLASAEVGDARTLLWSDGEVDAVLMFGPLYHLTDRTDRLQALREAHRVLRPGGILLAVAISRFASALDGLSRGYLKDAQFAEIVRRDLTDGQHRNPTGRPEYFMDTYFHHPDDLRTEVTEAGFAGVTLFGVEGLGWLLPDFESWWGNRGNRDRLLQLSRILETEPSILGASAHLMAVSTR